MAKTISTPTILALSWFLYSLAAAAPGRNKSERADEWRKALDEFRRAIPLTGDAGKKWLDLLEGLQPEQVVDPVPPTKLRGALPSPPAGWNAGDVDEREDSSLGKSSEVRQGFVKEKQRVGLMILDTGLDPVLSMLMAGNALKPMSPKDKVKTVIVEGCPGAEVNGTLWSLL